MTQKKHFGVFVIALILLLPSLAGAESLAVKRERIRYVNRLVDEIDTGTWSKNMIRAILWAESGWRQYNDDGTTLDCNGDIGIGQINIQTILDHPHWDAWRVYRDTKYNIQCAVQVLNEKQDLVYSIYADQERRVKFHRLYGILGESVIDTTILAYNGFQRSRKYPRLVREYWESEPWMLYVNFKRHKVAKP